jgi:hypothetical protein
MRSTPMAEREALSHELARFDLDVPQVEVEGERYDRVLRCETTYNSAAGPVRVERSLYRHPKRWSGALSVGAVRQDDRGIFWTPLAAKQATWAVAHLTLQESAELFELLGNMAPSKSTLDRLLKALSSHWEARVCTLRPPYASRKRFLKRRCRWPSPSME